VQARRKTLFAGLARAKYSPTKDLARWYDNLGQELAEKEIRRLLELEMEDYQRRFFGEFGMGDLEKEEEKDDVWR